MIIAYIGARGSGKTLSAVKYCLDRYLKGSNIFTNIKLNFPNHESAKIIYLNKEFFENYKNSGFEVYNSVVLIDECHVFFDSRNSMLKRNKIFGKFISQTRKRAVDLVYTSQDKSPLLFLTSGQVELRLRKLTDYIIFCEHYIDQGKDYIVNNICDQYGIGLKKEVYVGNELFKYYDTYEIVDLNFDD